MALSINCAGSVGAARGQLVPLVTPDLPKAAKYASLLATKDVQRVRDNKIFWVLMEMSIWMAINCKRDCHLQYTPTCRATPSLK